MFRRDPRHFAHSALITLHSGSRWGNAFQFTISAGPELSSVQVEATTDFLNWTAPVTVSLQSGTATYLDGFASSAQRFYRVSGANGYRSFNPYGYATRSVAANTWTMVSNPLVDTNKYTVRALFNGAPEETFINKLNQTTGMEEQASFESGVWNGPDLTLRAGEAVKVLSQTTPFVVTFIGEVLQGNLVNPIPAGYSWRSSMMPKGGYLTTQLLYPAGLGDKYEVLGAGGAFQMFAQYNGSQWMPSQPLVYFPTEGFRLYNNSAAKTWIQWFSVWPAGP